MGFDYMKYLRKEKMPHIWCAGCGHGIIMKAIIRAVDKQGLDPNRVVVVSGIGCVSRMPGYLDFNTLHTTHGRALAFATGVKMADPSLHVIAVMGDGDAIAIGGNHFIHACRRNIGITTIVANNYIYGMTGGQRSPTTPVGDNTSTTVYGNPDPPFDISALAIAAGASYVARTTTYHVQQIDRLIVQGLENSGFSMIEVIGPCFVAHGRRNRGRYKSNIDMYREEKEAAINITAAKGRSAAELMGKVTVGVLHQAPIAEYTDEYAKLMEKARARKGK